MSRARRALDEIADAEAEVSRATRALHGTLRVSASLAYGTRYVIPAAERFMKRAPKVRVELVVNDRYVDLVEEGIDVAVRLGTLDDASYKARLLGREELVVVATPRLIGKRPPQTVDDLLDRDAVVLVRRGVPTRWTFRENDAERVVTLSGRLHVDNVVAAYAAIRASLGIGVVPSYLAEDDLRSGAVVQLVPDVPLVGLPVYGVYLATRRLSAKAQGFLDDLAETITGRA